MQVMPMYYQFYENYLEHKDKFDILKHCVKIKQDVLILHGTNDSTVKIQDAEEIHRLVKKSKIFKILDADHTFGAIHPAMDNKIPIHLNKAIDASINFLSK